MAKVISNDELMVEFHALVRSERKITLQVLQMIAEIERRKIYLARAYSSLFEFLIKEFGYSAGAAMRRIDSARLLNEVPQAGAQLADGTLNLSHLSQVAQAVRQHEQKTKSRMPAEDKAELLQIVEGATSNETPALLAEKLDLEILPVPKKIIHRDRSVTISLTFTEGQMEEIQKAQDQLSHSLDSWDLSELLLHLCRKETKPRSVRQTPKTSDSKIPDSKTQESKTSEPKTPSSKTISRPVYRELVHEGACEYCDPQTGKVCGATGYLQVDHIQPRWAGGSNDAENLRVLCGAHNRWRYQQNLNQKYKPKAKPEPSP